MKYQINTSIIIQSKPSAVWKVLTEFEKYPFWNPFIKSIVGKIEVGKKFTVKFDSNTFKPTALVYNPNSEFTWLGRLFLPGIFDGKHSFILEENQDGSTTLFQQESFSGILVPLLKKKLAKEITDKFKLLNEGLKVRVESGSN